MHALSPMSKNVFDQFCGEGVAVNVFMFQKADSFAKTLGFSDFKVS